jgi:putative hydrolase of the HAD superfamily
MREVGVPDDLLAGSREGAERNDGPARGLIAAIERNHVRRRAEATPYPEVDIVDIWREVTTEIWPGAALDGSTVDTVDFRQLAVEYEVRVNPVWPMPGLVEVVTALDDAGLILGVISNAQFFTPLLFPALVDRTLEDLAFAAGMQYFSYRLGVAKPDEALYRQAAVGLGEAGIEAAHCGFRTALFAGDRRSLRLREDDPRVEGVVPDLIIDELISLLPCLQADSRD